jgi:hypothetical protein
MRIDHLIWRIRKAENSWKKIKDDFKGDFETCKYLSKAYLVLNTSRCQATVSEFKDNTFSMLSHTTHCLHPFLQNTPLNRRFLRKFGQNTEQKIKISNFLALLFKYIGEGKTLDPSKMKIDGFDMSEVAFDEDISVELRFFPTIKMDIIQTLKMHSLVDSSKTSMCASSIRVILK